MNQSIRKCIGMRLQEEVYQAYKEHISSHMEENRKGALAAKTALEHSQLYWDGMLDKTIHIPKVFDEETIAHFEQIVSRAYQIFNKVIAEYRNNHEYRKLFPFSHELEELILLPVQYDSYLPILRMDLFYHEDSGEFRFCEINTDGTAAMLRDYELRKALVNNPAHQAIIRQYDLQPFELFDSWVDTFMSLYQAYPKKKDKPNVALVDFLENATLREFEEFVRHFQDAGINCEICDVRSLKYQNGELFSGQGNRIDAIYRRAVTADIIAHYDESSELLDAVRDDAVFIAGSFASQLIHTKWIFYVLHHAMTRAVLSDEENAFVKAHIPTTVEFSADYIALEEVIEKKDDYIIKPMDAYASKGTYASGREYTKEQWKDIISKLYGKKYICQQYCTQYLKDNIDFAWGDGNWHPYINMPGLYVYNGRFTGILMRSACEEKIINAHDNERTMPVFVVKSRKD